MATPLADYKSIPPVQILTRLDLLVVANAGTVAMRQESFSLQPMTPYTTDLYHSTTTSDLGFKKKPLSTVPLTIGTF